MSYYFTIIGTKDDPLFEHEFGTSKHGGDGVARFRAEQRHLNPFVAHASLDMVEEAQWGKADMYLKLIDRHPPISITAFLTPSNTKFLLLIAPNEPSSHPNNPTHTSKPTRFSTTSTSSASSSSSAGSLSLYSLSSSSSSTTTAAPLGPATEDAIRNFFVEVYENWIKTVMNPFYGWGPEGGRVRSPVFRARVAAAARKYL